VDAYADMLGVDPRLIVGNKEVAMVRQARNEAAAAQEQIAAQREQAAAAKDLASAQTGEKNALTDIMGMFSGYQSPTASEV